MALLKHAGGIVSTSGNSAFVNVSVSGTLAVTSALTGSNSITSSHATAGIGYSAGAGGSVTQGTSRSTGVTLNKVSGQIVTHNASLAAGAKAAFTVTNSAMAATDTVVAVITSGGTGTPRVDVIGFAAGSFVLQVTNDHGATADTSADVICFTIIKGTTS